MSLHFDRAFALVVNVEAGLSTDPNDPGNYTGGHVGVGELKGTKYGISAASYPNVDIANLTEDGAKAIYLSDFWNAVQGDGLPWPLALLVFDSAVNQGVGTAKVMLQQALGVAADGVIGEATLTAAAHSTIEHAARFMRGRVRRYLASANAQLYGDGWIDRCFEIALNQGEQVS
jgi:lysozyme family protein